MPTSLTVSPPATSSEFNILGISLFSGRNFANLSMNYFGTLAEESCFLAKECSKFLTEFDILMGNLFHFLSNMIFYCSTQREIPYLHTSMHCSPPMNLMSSERKQAI